MLISIAYGSLLHLVSEKLRFFVSMSRERIVMEHGPSHVFFEIQIRYSSHFLAQPNLCSCMSQKKRFLSTFMTGFKRYDRPGELLCCKASNPLACDSQHELGNPEKKFEKSIINKPFLCGFAAYLLHRFSTDLDEIGHRRSAGFR